MKTRSKIYRTVIINLLHFYAFLTNRFRKTKIEFVFYYSEKQANCLNNSFALSNYPTKSNVKFKEKLYTEMRAFKYGYCNWDDAKIVGIGNYSDITICE